MKAGKAAKLIVDALLQRFLPLARRRIETTQAQDRMDSNSGHLIQPMSKYWIHWPWLHVTHPFLFWRPFTMERKVHIFSYRMDSTSGHLIQHMSKYWIHWPWLHVTHPFLFWRPFTMERKFESPKGANDASTFQRKLAVERSFVLHVFALWNVVHKKDSQKLWMGLENFVFNWLINADSQVEYPLLVDLRSPLLDLVALLLGSLSRIRFSSVTERFFMELNTRRIDTNVARNEALGIINGMRYLKLGVKTEGGLNASASFVAKANPLNRAPHKRKTELHHAFCNMLSNILAPLADGRKGQWPPSSVDPALTLWYEAVARIRIQLMHWMDKQSYRPSTLNIYRGIL
ncbi:hypothetical protein P3S68_018528 [Capsicum galapagoense]